MTKTSNSNTIARQTPNIDWKIIAFYIVGISFLYVQANGFLDFMP
jgi:hypothetical protein